MLFLCEKSVSNVQRQAVLAIKPSRLEKAIFKGMKRNPGEVVVQIRVQPKAKRTEVIPFEQGLKVALQVPPIDGKANESLVRVLADHWNVRASSVRILSGLKSKDKLVGYDPEATRQ